MRNFFRSDPSGASLHAKMSKVYDVHICFVNLLILRHCIAFSLFPGMVVARMICLVLPCMHVVFLNFDKESQLVAQSIILMTFCLNIDHMNLEDSSRLLYKLAFYQFAVSVFA